MQGRGYIDNEETMTKNEDISIGTATPTDREWIADFQVRMARESENMRLDPDTVLKGVGHLLSQPSRGFYIFAKTGTGDPVGSLLVQKEWSDWRNADVWWIHSVYIIPDYRRRGIFKKMFEAVEHLAKEQHIAGLRLYVDKTNSAAQAVYTRLNMTKEHYEMFEKMF